MKKRIPHIALLAAALVAWWISDHEIMPWVQRVAGYDRIHDRGLSILLGHWVFGQLPRVLICVAVWLVGSHFGLMPSLRQSLASGVSWRRVIVTSTIATSILLVLTVGIGLATGGTFGFHSYFLKMSGDLVSNMYEEIVYRGLMFCAFYGVAAAASFPLVGKLDRAGLIVGTIGSCVVFAVGHKQYSIALRVVVGGRSRIRLSLDRGTSALGPVDPTYAGRRDRRLDTQTLTYRSLSPNRKAVSTPENWAK